MELYKSKFLSINKEDGFLIQKWSGESLTASIFQYELLQFKKIFKKTSPSAIIWDQKEFNFHIPVELFKWIEKNVNCIEYQDGISEIYFTISKSQETYSSVVKSFYEVNSVLQPVFFSQIEEAKKHSESSNKIITEQEPFQYNIDIENDQILFNLKCSLNEYTKILDFLKSIKDEREFITKNHSLFMYLTNREKEILRLIALNYSNKQISQNLVLSYETIRTHRKNIVRKLKIKNKSDFYLYAKFFRLIHFR